jgi:hypothetical protein
MRDEPLINHMYAGHPSKEQCILAMLDAATGWEPIPSPVAQEGGSAVAAPRLAYMFFPLQSILKLMPSLALLLPPFVFSTTHL